jgi:hypothetical protein
MITTIILASLLGLGLISSIFCLIKIRNLTKELSTQKSSPSSEKVESEIKAPTIESAANICKNENMDNA